MSTTTGDTYSVECPKCGEEIKDLWDGEKYLFWLFGRPPCKCTAALGPKVYTSPRPKPWKE